jgi:hypothetical protein
MNWVGLPPSGGLSVSGTSLMKNGAQMGFERRFQSARKTGVIPSILGKAKPAN